MPQFLLAAFADDGYIATCAEASPEAALETTCGVVLLDTTNGNPGPVVPMPTFPPAVTLRMEVLEEEATSKGSVVPLP